MDCYLATFGLKEGVRDSEFVADLDGYLAYLKSDRLIEGHRLLRRKLGLGPGSLGEFLLLIEVRDMAQLEAAFQHVGTRASPVEDKHFAVNSKVRDLTFALYRDFPDSFRQFGEERF